jgi:hypothetical protein
MTTKVDYTDNLMEDSHDGAAEEAFSDLMDTLVMTRCGLARTLTWTHMRGLAFHFGGMIHLGAITSNSLHYRESGPRKHPLTIWETDEHTRGGAVLKCRASLVREAVLDFSSTTYARPRQRTPTSISYTRSIEAFATSTCAEQKGTALREGLQKLGLCGICTCMGSMYVQGRINS